MGKLLLEDHLVHERRPGRGEPDDAVLDLRGVPPRRLGLAGEDQREAVVAGHRRARLFEHALLGELLLGSPDVDVVARLVGEPRRLVDEVVPPGEAALAAVVAYVLSLAADAAAAGHLLERPGRGLAEVREEGTASRASLKTDTNA